MPQNKEEHREMAEKKEKLKKEDNPEKEATEMIDESGSVNKALKDEFEMASNIIASKKNIPVQEKDELIDYSNFEKNLNVNSQSYLGVKPIKIEDIVGSLGRYANFNAKFMPTTEASDRKAKGVRTMKEHNSAFPAIKVYQVSDKYFVVDGHHRVMVSKERDKDFIDAEITKIEFDFELDSNKEYTFNSNEAKKLLIRFEGETFQKKTHLWNDMLVHPIKVSEVSTYSKLYDLIMAHHKQNTMKNVYYPFLMSAQDWYRKDFLPAVESLEKENLLMNFPNRTYTDLYVWIQTHKYYLSEKAGYDVGIDVSKGDFVRKFAKGSYLSGISNTLIGYLKKMMTSE